MYKLQKYHRSILKYGFGKYYSDFHDNTMCKYLLPRNFYASRDLNNNSKYLQINNKLQIRKVLFNDIPNVLNILRENFAKCEPLVKGLQFPDNTQYSPALNEFWRNSIQQGMSYIVGPNNVIETENSLGVAVNTKILPWEPDHWWKFATCIKCTKTRDLITLYGFLIKDSEMHKKYQTNTIFNIAHIVVNQMKCKEYNENFKNVSHALVNNSLEVGKSLGYEYGTLMCASDELSGIANDLYMELIYEYPCDKLVNDKLEPILYNINPNSYVRVFIKKLKVDKNNILEPHLI